MVPGKDKHIPVPSMAWPEVLREVSWTRTTVLRRPFLLASLVAAVLAHAVAIVAPSWPRSLAQVPQKNY